MKKLLVLGATSAIAQAWCRTQAAPDTHFWLVGRNEARLSAVAADLLARGSGSATVRTHTTGDFSGLEAALGEGFLTHGHFDVFLAAQGVLPDQTACENDPRLAAEVLQVNTIEIMQAALLVAGHFEHRGSGACVIIGSVAGDVGRRTNYVYGASKAALDVFCEGLRQRLMPAVPVLFVKPGPVDTPMSAHLKKTALFTTPEKVAASITKGIRNQSAIIYSPSHWRLLMTIIRLLPRKVIRRLQA
jgi:short-subunit dehydrogenase